MERTVGSGFLHTLQRWSAAAWERAGFCLCLIGGKQDDDGETGCGQREALGGRSGTVQACDQFRQGAKVSIEPKAASDPMAFERSLLLLISVIGRDHV